MPAANVRASTNIPGRSLFGCAMPISLARSSSSNSPSLSRRLLEIRGAWELSILRLER